MKPAPKYVIDFFAHGDTIPTTQHHTRRPPLVFARRALDLINFWGAQPGGVDVVYTRAKVYESHIWPDGGRYLGTRRARPCRARGDVEARGPYAVRCPECGVPKGRLCVEKAILQLKRGYTGRIVPVFRQKPHEIRRKYAKSCAKRKRVRPC